MTKPIEKPPVLSDEKIIGLWLSGDMLENYRGVAQAQRDDTFRKTNQAWIEMLQKYEHKVGITNGDMWRGETIDHATWVQIPRENWQALQQLKGRDE